MAVKRLFLLVVVLAIVLLVCQDTTHARELTTANDLKGNVEPEIRPDGIRDKKLFIGIGIFGRRPNFGAGGFQPGFGGGFGGYGNGLGFGRGLVPGGVNNGFGGGFRGQGSGIPGF